MPREAFSRPGAIFDPVDEGILERRSRVYLEPKRPRDGTPSAMRGEDPDKDYVDHAGPDAVYFVDEPWEEEHDLPVAEVTPAADPEPAAEIDRAAPLADRASPLAGVSPIADAPERLARLHASGFLTDDETTLVKQLALGPDPDDGRSARPLLCVDFDGVPHSYASGWKGPTNVPDPPVEGAIEWLVSVDARFDIAITSVRNAYPGAADAMRAWLGEHGLPQSWLSRIAIPRHTPRGAVHIDDRGYRFEGRFPTFDELGEPEPWFEKKIFGKR